MASRTELLSPTAVRESITKGRPLVPKFDHRVVAEPIRGIGLSRAKGRRGANR